MRLNTFLILLALLSATLCAETFPVPGQPFAPRGYVCQHVLMGINVDGDLNEVDWLRAPWSEDFTDIEGGLKPKPYLDTRVKMLWGPQGLYIAAQIMDPQIWAKLTEHDSVIFKDNDFEVFIDPDGDSHSYAEIEVNAFSTVWDLFIQKPYRVEHTALNSWECKGMQCAVSIEGSLNDQTDTDLEWSVEMLLPWPALAEFAQMPCPPNDGDYWRINFSRVQWETEVRDGVYEKIPGRAEHNWVWSPQGLVNMHYPERWGYLLFTDTKVGMPHPGFSLPSIELAREYLYRVYYAERQYWLDNGKYTDSLSRLRLGAASIGGQSIKARLETTSRTFLATLKIDARLSLTINEEGRIIQIKQ